MGKNGLKQAFLPRLPKEEKKSKKVSKKVLTTRTTFGIIYSVVSDGNELLSLRHANLENDT